MVKGKVMADQWVMISVKLRPEEKRLLDRRADKLKVSVTEIVRMGLVLEAVTAGDLEALKLVGGRLAEWATGRMSRVQRVGAEVA